MDQLLLTTSARTRPVTLAGSYCSSDHGHSAYLFHDLARNRKPARPPRVISRPELRQSKLGFAPHGRERTSRARVYYFSPAPFHRPQIQSSVSASETRSAESLRRLLDDGL